MSTSRGFSMFDELDGRYPTDIAAEIIKEMLDDDNTAVGISNKAAREECMRRKKEMSNFENDVNYLVKSITGFKESHRQLLEMEKDLYRNYLNKEEFDIRSIIGELNMGLLTDILTEEELTTDKEDLLLTLVVRFAEDVINDIPNGQEVWESASAYDFSKVFENMSKIVTIPDTTDELTKYLYSGLISRIYMAMPISDLPIEFYKQALTDDVVKLQELLIVAYILDNIGVGISPNTANILLELVNDETYYVVSDYPILESIKSFAIVMLRGKVETIAE